METTTQGQPLEIERKFLIRMPEREILSGWKVLYWELYREEAGYEVHLMLTNGAKQPYLTLRCREIEWAYLADPA